MARTPVTKAPSFLAELWEFSKNHGNTPYQDLPTAFLEAGWVWRLQETGVMPMTDGTVLVQYDLLLGKNPESLEVFDALTMRMNTSPGPISLAARVMAAQTVIYLVTGRTPPMPVPHAAPATDARPAAAQQMNGHDTDEIDVTMDDTDVVLPGERATWEPKPKLNLVDHREPDGLPILRDLYEISQPEVESTTELVDAVVDFVRGFLDTASSPAQIDALASKNPDLATFVRDFGTDEQSAALLEAIGTRRRQLAAGVDAPRRRTPASAAN